MFPSDFSNQYYVWYNGIPYLVYNGAMIPVMHSSGAPMYAQNYAPSLFMGPSESMPNHSFNNGYYGNFVPDHTNQVSLRVNLQSERCKKFNINSSAWPQKPAVIVSMVKIELGFVFTNM